MNVFTFSLIAFMTTFPKLIDCSNPVLALFAVNQSSVFIVYTTPTCTDLDGDVVFASCSPGQGSVVSIYSQVQCICVGTFGATDVSCTLPVTGMISSFPESHDFLPSW